MARIYKREKNWYLDYSYKGRRIRKKVGNSKKIAELALKDIELQIARDEYKLTKQDIKVEHLIDRFLEYNSTNNRESTTKRYRSIMNHFKEFLEIKNISSLKASQLNEGIIEQYKSFRKNTYTNPNGYKINSKKEIKKNTRKGARSRTINIEVDGIKYMMNLAVKWNYLRENPIKSVKSLKQDDKKPFRFLSTEEIKMFLEKTPDHLYPVFFTLLHTGMRKGEVENLCWSDLDLERRKIFIRSKEDWNPKTGEREIPINDDLYKVLLELKKKSNNRSPKKRIFELTKYGKSHNFLRRELLKVAKEAEIENFTQLHSLRHTFASHLVMNGVDLPTVKKLLGHADIQTTMIYAHLAPDHLVDSVNKLKY